MGFLKRKSAATANGTAQTAAPAELNATIYLTVGSLVPALVSSTLLAVRAYRRRSLTPSGCAAGFMVGMVTTNVGGIVPTLALYNFFVTSTWLTKMGAETKRKIAVDLGGNDHEGVSAERQIPDVSEAEAANRQKANQGRDEELIYHKSGNRNAWQVFSNGGVASALLLVYLAKQCGGETSLPTPLGATIKWVAANDKAIMMAVVAHYAAAIGDTYSSEVGVLSGMGAKVLAGQSKWVQRSMRLGSWCVRVVSRITRFAVGSEEQEVTTDSTATPQCSTTTKNYARLILGGRVVPKGTNGGVSWLGTASAVLGGLQLAIVIAALTIPIRKERDPLRMYAPPPPTITQADAAGESKKHVQQLRKLTGRCTIILQVIGTILSPLYTIMGPTIVHTVRVRDLFWVCPSAALVGTVVDSILGQLFQASYATKKAVKEAEESYRGGAASTTVTAVGEEEELVHVSGIPLLTNNQVNALSLLIVTAATFAYFKINDTTVDGVVGVKDEKVAFVDKIIKIAKLF